MIKLNIILLALCFLTFSTTYQENVINSQGTAKLEVTPDMATITIGVTAIHEVSDSAIYNCANRFMKFKNVLKEFSISDNDIKSTEFSLNNNWEYINRERTKNGYKANKKYTITLRDLSRLKMFLYQLTVFGANDFDKLQFSHSKKDSLQEVARELALKNSKDIALKMSKEMGVKLGRPIIISNEKPKAFSYENVMKIGWVSAPSFTKGGGVLENPKEPMKNLKYLEEFFDVNPGLIEIKSKTYVTYQIKQ